MQFANDAATRLKTLIGGFLPDCALITHDQDLRDLGLTSIQMVELMLSIEAEFDVTIPPSRLSPTNFRSIGRIETLLTEIDK
jgi:acyl carrier protein